MTLIKKQLLGLKNGVPRNLGFKKSQWYPHGQFPSIQYMLIRYLLINYETHERDSRARDQKNAKHSLIRLRGDGAR